MAEEPVYKIEKPEPPAIYTLIPKLMASIGAIPKERTNRQQGFKYRSVDDVLNAIHPALVEHRATIGMEVPVSSVRWETLREAKPGGGERLIMRACLILHLSIYAEDGSGVTFVGVGEGLDYGGDKSSGKALSYAYKYALCLGLGIPFLELADPDADERVGEKGPPRAQDVQRDPYSERPAVEPAKQEQLTEISRLCDKLEYGPELRSRICEKRGVNDFPQLSIQAAEELLDKLMGAAGESKKEKAPWE